jgi:hypothetical protein
LSEQHGGIALATQGLYRDRDGWVMVQYDKHQAIIDRDTYVANGYVPPYDSLPTQDQYNQAAAKKAFDDIAKEAAKTPQERTPGTEPLDE